MNRSGVIQKLVEKTGYSEEKCEILGEILDNHFVVGRNNKEKIVKDIIEKLNVSEEEADKLYNNCMEVLVKGIFKK